MTRQECHSFVIRIAARLRRDVAAPVSDKAVSSDEALTPGTVGEAAMAVLIGAVEQ